MTDFGFSRSESQTLQLDKQDLSLLQRIAQNDPDILTCMACGSCAASCTSGAYLPMNLRQVILYIQRGLAEEALQQTAHCMFCGKCSLVCPRGINTRPLILAIRKEISKPSKSHQHAKE